MSPVGTPSRHSYREPQDGNEFETGFLPALEVQVLTLHVGIQKTGSTAIQQHFRGSGFQTDEPFSFFGPPDFRGWIITGRPEAAPDLYKLERALRSGRNVLVSNENLLGSIWDVHADAPQRVTRVLDHFLPITEVRLLIFLRPQHTWVESAYRQFIHDDSSGTTGTDFAQRMLEREFLRYVNLLSTLKRVAGPDRLVVRAYSSAVDVVPEVLSLVNLEQSAPRLADSNPSLTAVEVEMLRRLNREMGPISRKNHLRFLRLRQPPQDEFRYSSIPLNLQEELRSLAMNDWSQLPTAVVETRLARPDSFYEVCREIAGFQPRPDLTDPVGQARVLDAMTEICRTTIPQPDLMSWRAQIVRGASKTLRNLKAHPMKLPRSLIEDVARVKKYRKLGREAGSRD